MLKMKDLAYMLGVYEVILGNYFKISNFLVSALKINGDYFSACFFHKYIYATFDENKHNN